MALHQVQLLCLSTGIASSQIGLKCGPVCLLAELSCSCEFNNNVLGWKLIDSNNDQIGQPASFLKGSSTVGATATFAAEQFTATLTNDTNMTLTSVATGIVTQTSDGYTLQCFDGNDNTVVDDTEISIPGKLLLTTITSYAFQTNVCIVFDLQMSPPSQRT